MKIEATVQVDRELLTPKINDEYLFRDLARKLVSEMPLNELHKLMKLTKTDPLSEESANILKHSRDYKEVSKIAHLQEMNVIQYDAVIDLI